MENSVHPSLHPQQPVTFTTYFLRSLLWNHSISKPFQYVCLIVSHIQCTAILLWILLYRITTQSQDMFSLAIKNISGFVSIRTMFGFSLQYPIGILVSMNIVFLTYFLILIATCAFVALRFWNKTRRSGKRDIILIYLCQFHIHIGFWVINAIVFSYLAIGLFHGNVSALNTDQIIVSALFVLSMVLNYFFAVLFVVYSYDPFMTSNPLSCHSPGFQAATFIFKASLAPIVTIIHNPLAQTWVLVLVSLLILGIGHLYLIYAFPYYQYHTMKTSLILNTLNLVIAFASLICFILKTSDVDPSGVIVYILAVIIPLILKFASMRFHSTVLRYLAIQNKDLKSTSDVMKRLFSLSYITSKSVFTLNNQHNKTSHELRFWGLLNNMTENNMTQAEKCDGRFTLTEMSTHYTSIGRDMIKSLLQDAISRFKDNSHFKILFARFTLENNLPFLATSICLADTINFNGHAKLAAQNLAQSLQENINEYFQENTGKVLHLQNFMELETESDTLRKSILSISEKYNRFWMKYLHPTIKMKDVYNRSKEIEIEADQITELWQNYANKNKIFAHQFSSVYSLYLSLIRGCPYEGQYVVQRYFIQHFEGLYDLDNTIPLSDHNIISPYVIAFYASMTPENTGQVLSSSSNLTKHLGWTHHDIVGHNVERILPFFMQAAHQNMLSKHITNAFNGETGSRMYRTIDAFVLHKLGHIIPCEVYLSIHPFVQERPRYMVLTRVNKGKRDHLLINRRGVIEGYTERLGEILGLNLERKILLSSLCQHCIELEEVLNNLTLPNKGDYEALNAMKRTFMLDFPISNNNSRKKEEKIQSYMVELKPKYFGDLFYFVLDLDEKSKAQADRYRSSIMKTEHTVPHLNNSNDSLYNEIQSEDNDVDLIPTFKSSFLNLNKMTMQSERFITSTLPQETDTGLIPSPKMTRIKLVDRPSRMTDKDALAKLFNLETLNNTRGPERLISEAAEQVNLLVDPGSSLISLGKCPLSPVGSAKPLVERVDTREDLKASTKDGNTTNAMKIRIMAASSVGMISKSSTSKIETVVKLVPKSKKVKKLYFLMVLFMIALSTPLIVFHFYNQSTLTLVQSSVKTISKAIFRLVAIADLGEYIRILWDFQNGLFDSERWHQLGWTDNSTEYAHYLVSTYTSALKTQNNELRSFVYELDTTLQNELYSEDLPVYEMDEYGVMRAERSGNTFDIITQLVSEATLFLSTDLPLDHNNPHMMFVLSNTFNDLLTSSERAVFVLSRDIEVKFANQTEYLYWFMSILGVIGVLLLIYFYHVERNFKKDRRHFISVFSLLNENAIERHLQEVQDFLNLLDTPVYETKRIGMKPHSRTFYGYSSARNRNARHSKKVAETKGLNTILIVLYCGAILFVIVLFSVYPVLIFDVKACSKSILTKTHLMIKSNLNFFYVNFLFKVLYEYVQENGSTKIMNKPIKEAWEQIYDDMAQAQTFFLIELLEPGNGISDNPELQQMVNGDMCAILDFPPPYEYAEVICNRIGGGAAKRGLAGLVGYILSSAKLAKDHFDNSQKTWEDMQNALSVRGLVDVEDFYYDNLRAIMWVDRLIREQISQDFTRYEDSLFEIIIPYLIVYVLAGGVLSRKITEILQKEISDWRKLLRQIPHLIMSEDKQMKAYLAKISGGILKLYD